VVVSDDNHNTVRSYLMNVTQHAVSHVLQQSAPHLTSSITERKKKITERKSHPIHTPLNCHPTSNQKSTTMVKIQEVEDEHFTDVKPAFADDAEDDDFTDTDSEISDEEEDDDELEETLYDRLVALKDIVPLKQRTYLSNGASRTYRWISKGLSFGGSTLWVLTTSVMILGVPYAVALQGDQQLAEMEKEYNVCTLQK
jgi:import receptor subunit TOM22